MYDQIYVQCATIYSSAEHLVNCKNRAEKPAQRRAIQTIQQYARRLNYAVQTLETVPGASMQSYIRRQILDALAPIVGSAQMLHDNLFEGLNNCQTLYLNDILNSANSLLDMLNLQPGETVS